MAKRKTIAVTEIVDTVNACLRDSKADASDVRQGMINLLGHILHTTGNYKGFRYLLADEVKDGVPGVNYVNGQPDPDVDRRFANTDRTRVMFF